MIIPYTDIAEATLHNLVKEFVLREGTDYGDSEVPLATKVEQVLTQIKQGKLVITYSEEYESIDICPVDKFKQGNQ